jgi:hypothetical protein
VEVKVVILPTFLPSFLPSFSPSVLPSFLLFRRAGHTFRNCPAPSIDYQLQRDPKLVAHLAQGDPVSTSDRVVIDVDEFQPTAAEFTDGELTALQEVGFSKRAADGEEIGF